MRFSDWICMKWCALSGMGSGVFWVDNGFYRVFVSVCVKLGHITAKGTHMFVKKMTSIHHHAGYFHGTEVWMYAFNVCLFVCTHVHFISFAAAAQYSYWLWDNGFRIFGFCKRYRRTSTSTSTLLHQTVWNIEYWISVHCCCCCIILFHRRTNISVYISLAVQTYIE